MQKHPEIHPRGHEVMAEDPPTGDSQRQGTPPDGGVPGAGLGGLVGPEDDWDQEASLAAFVLLPFGLAQSWLQNAANAMEPGVFTYI